MHTTQLWAMAHLTCYHCRITCVSRITNSNLYRWSHPRTIALVAGVAFNATTSTEYFQTHFGANVLSSLAGQGIDADSNPRVIP
ncbi:Uncharacterised protein [Salmonella enterica]|nr:Uncharacterised protein [Salmonella enterica]